MEEAAWMWSHPKERPALVLSSKESNPFQLHPSKKDTFSGLGMAWSNA